MNKVMWLLILVVVGCSKKPIQIDPPETTNQRLLRTQGIDCSFFEANPEAARDSILSCEDHERMWLKSKSIYLERRVGLTDDERSRVHDLKLNGLYTVVADKPEDWREIITLSGRPARIPLIKALDLVQPIQGYYYNVPFPRIYYGNPYCLICEYFHYIENIIRPLDRRPDEYASDGQGEYIWQVIGHCTPDDPINNCCWSTYAYDLPSGVFPSASARWGLRLETINGVGDFRQ